MTRSSLARASNVLVECAAGLSFNPPSHNGYQMPSATLRTVSADALPGWTRMTSMSLPGVNAPPAYPPVAINDQPGGRS